MAEKGALIAGLIALSAFTSLTKTTGHANRRVVNKAAEKVSKMVNISYGKIDPLAQIISTSYRKGDDDSTLLVDIIAADTHGKEYRLTLADNKLITMDINGEKVKNSDLPKYQYMINVFEGRQKAYGTVLTDKLRKPMSLTPTFPLTKPTHRFIFSIKNMNGVILRRVLPITCMRKMVGGQNTVLQLLSLSWLP